jgi:hypothetical protein
MDRADAELVFCELIGNVVRHAAYTVDVEVIADHGGAHSVPHMLDRGRGFHYISRLPSDPYAENGRGLFLIAALTVDFTVAERPYGGSHARVALRGGSHADETPPTASAHSFGSLNARGGDQIVPTETAEIRRVVTTDSTHRSATN